MHIRTHNQALISHAKIILNQLDTEILGIMNATEEKVFGNVLAGGFYDRK